MESKDRKPLGYIELTDGLKAIYPMNDIFLNYNFENTENWEDLRLIVNLFIEEFIKLNPDTRVEIIEGELEVRTQFKHLLNMQNTTRDQDIKMIVVKVNATYVEFQNRAKPDIPIEIRSVEYFGLGIGHSKGKLANQIWLLAEDVESVLHNETFTRYILQDEVTGKAHPTESGIMYISLTKLSQQNTPVGELASFLLGKTKNPKHEVVKKIAKSFNASFANFKADKEIVNMLSLAERYEHDGIVKGEANIANKVMELIEKGVDPKDISALMQKIASKHEELGNNVTP